MSATQPPADAVVEQRHRDAALFLFNEPDDEECRAGRLDHTQAVQAFAAFEAAIRPAIIAEQIERDAALVGSYVEALRPPDTWAKPFKEGFKVGVADCSAAIAAAIRQQEPSRG